MLDITKFKRFLKHDEVTRHIDEIWDLVGQSFVEEQANLPPELAMPRKELSFHDQVKFLGYLCWLIADVPGDIIEIGVWKGKSISFMSQMCLKQRRIIGVDPMALPNQPSELGLLP